jgi:predicted MPP superfamily phosphohydrolase
MADSTFNKLEQIQAKLKNYVPTIAESMVIDGEARYLSWDFSEFESEELSILQITDIQFGHKQCKVEKLQEYIDWVLAEPNRYVVLGGDLVHHVGGQHLDLRHRRQP